MCLELAKTLALDAVNLKEKSRNTMLAIIASHLLRSNFK